jgi:hypothetical protein
MRIHRRVAFILIVVLMPVTASFAGDHRPTVDSGVADAASTTVEPPQPRSIPEELSPVRDDATRQKTLALLILMFKEGRGAR